MLPSTCAEMLLMLMYHNIHTQENVSINNTERSVSYYNQGDWSVCHGFHLLALNPWSSSDYEATSL